MIIESIASLIAALGALGALIIAIWSLATTRKTRSTILEVEDTFKKNEMIRLRFLEAIDTFLEPLVSMISSIGNLRFTIEHAGGISGETLDENLQKFGKERGLLFRSRYRFAPYLPDEVLEQLDRIYVGSEKLELTIQNLDNLKEQFISVADEVAQTTRRKILNV